MSPRCRPPCERIQQRRQRARRDSGASRLCAAVLGEGPAAHRRRAVRPRRGGGGLGGASWPASPSPSPIPISPRSTASLDYRPKLPMRVFSADGVLLGEFGEERRNFVPIARDPEGDAGRGARGRGRQVLPAQRRQLRERDPRRPGQLRRGAQRPGRIDDHDAGRAQFLSLVRENIYSQDLRDVAFAEDREPADQGADSRGLHEPYLRSASAHIGFASASEIYFGKPLKDITVAEAAMLAGLPKAPSANNPIVNPERATIRQRYIIDRMLDNGFITVEQREAARKQVLRYRTPSEVAVHAEYVAEQARQMIFNQYGPEAYTRGLNVWLTLDSGDQTLAYRALRKGILDYERRQVYRGPEDYIDLPADLKEMDARIADALPGLSGQRRAEGGGRDRGLGQEGRGGAAERAGDHDHRRGAEAGDLGAGRQGQSEDADPARRRRPHRPRPQGRLDDHAAAGGRGRVRRARPAHRRRPRDGRRLRLLEEQVQPRHAGLAPAGLELQALHLLGVAGEGLHAGDRHQRRAAVLRRRRDRQPALGAEELRRQVRRADDAAPRRSRSRRT